MKIVFTPSVHDQFMRVLAYIRRDNSSEAILFRYKTEKILLRLKDQPESGRALSEFPESHFREVIVAPYRFFYRVKDNVIWIVAAWHDAQISFRPEEYTANLSPENDA
ncbi:MAG: type II toxin-antitoxin system RelE/ParE family toxin [Desulfuromonadaceae bacterium]|nr:type II toxin-antitoxin system RelE/ParE family toxin [Desulfuromonadaceae bacterium]